MRRPTALPVLALALVLAGCGGATDGATGGSSSPASPSPAPSRSPSPSPSPSPTPSPHLAATCSAPGYTVGYPQDWSVDEDGEPCRWFHPEPFTLPEAQEATGIAVSLRYAPRPFADMVSAVEDGLEEVVAREQRTVDGRQAVRYEKRASGQALLPEGTRSTQWLVDAGPRALLATTSQTASAGTYEDNVAVLDAMVRSLRLDVGGAPCSATGLPAQLPPQQGLPAPVERTRQQLYAAAVSCDLEGLAALAPDEGFSYTFGSSQDPASYWAVGEERGDAPLRHLAGVLRLPHGQQTVQGRTTWAWPEAFVFDSWAQVPERAKQDLRRLYDEQAMERFAQFGAYAGYRVVVGDDGTWRAFVAGD